MEISIEVDPETVCRACMAVSPNMRPLFQTEEGCEQTPSDILSFVTNMIVKQEDKLPKHICHDCEVLMRQSCMFKRRCIDSETKFLMLHTDEKALLGITKKPYVKSENLVETPGSKLEQPYQCSICVLKFSDILSLYTHVRKIHSKIENASGIEVTLFSATKDNVVTPSLSTDDVKDNNQCIKEEILDANHFLEDDLENFESNLIEGESIYHASKENDKGYTAFTCSSCNVTLDSKVKYQEHIRDTHLTLSAIKKECKNNRKKSQTTERIIGKDKVVLSETKTFICEYCNLKLKTNKSYKNHIKRKHSEMRDTAITKLKVKEEKEVERKHQCSHCMRKFVKKSTLALHLKRHENSTCTHVCSICKREFKHRAHLDNHILSVHTSQNGLKCNICPKSFATQESLDLHKTMHSNEKKHQCKFCSKAFNMLSTLRDHLRVHTGEKPFLCPQCGKGFTQNTNLIEHLRRHQGIKPFKCDLCDRRFVSKGELAAHARKHTGAHPFVCDDCGGGFTTSSSLVKHRRTHTGERPYGCDLCHMKFAASGTLKNHRRTHTGEKPYKCTHCEKAFVQKNDLVAHTRCHTGERPYVCSTCGQAFRQGSALKAHLKMHQGKPALGRTGTI